MEQPRAEGRVERVWTGAFLRERAPGGLTPVDADLPHVARVLCVARHPHELRVLHRVHLKGRSRELSAGMNLPGGIRRRGSTTKKGEKGVYGAYLPHDADSEAMRVRRRVEEVVQRPLALGVAEARDGHEDEPVVVVGL